MIVAHIYGAYTSECSVVGNILTAQITIVALIMLDCPTEMGWHCRALLRIGGSLDQIRFAMDIAKSTCEILGLSLRVPLPPLESIVGTL